MKTTEPCPVCKNPEATCEHGIKDAETGLFVHLWNCPDCGESAALVGYDCPECTEAVEEEARGRE